MGPKQLAPDVRFSKTFRFASAVNVAVTVTVANMLQLMCVALTATSSVRLFRSIRLVRVECWAIGAIGGAPEVVRVSGIGDGPQSVASDMSMGVRPAHVVWRPPARSRSSLWYDTGSSEADGLFEIDAPSGTVFDLTLEVLMVNNFDSGSATAGPVPAGASPGAIYLCSLDGNGLTGKFVPEDYLLLP